MPDESQPTQPVQPLEHDEELMNAETEEQRREIMKSRSGKPQDELMGPGEEQDG